MAKKKLEHKQFPLEAKDVDLQASTFEGFSAAIGNIDEAMDRIVPGAFQKTINERVRAGRVKLLDQHPASNPFRSSTEALWGVVLEASEQKLTTEQREQLAAQAARDIDDAPTHGLRTLFKVSRAQPAQDFLAKVAEGIADALSIGFNATKVDFVPLDDADEDEDVMHLWFEGRAVRELTEIAWWETSGVIFGANPFALVLPGTLRELKRFAEEAEIGPGEEREIRAIIESLQKMAPGCPTKGAVEDLMPRVERMAQHLEAVRSGLTDTLVDAAETFTASLDDGHRDKRAIRSFVNWVGKGFVTPHVGKGAFEMPCGCVKVDGKNIKGERLAARLNNLIDDLAEDDDERAEIIERMAEAAGISVSTVNQILRGSINCPPLERLRGFARVLDTSVDDLVAAAEGDGCSYEEESALRFSGCCKVDGIQIKGERLAAVLNRRIDDIADDDEERSEIIDAMAEAAGIARSTVNQILRGSINCPPLDRLAGFARVLRISQESLVSAAEQDGCEYDEGSALDISRPGVTDRLSLIQRDINQLMRVVRQAAGETPTEEGRPEHLSEESDRQVIEAELAKLSVLEAELAR